MNEEKIKEERLEGFEKALKDILNEYEKLGKELEILRNDGKMKTTKFRELLGKKLVYSMIITIFKRYDLINDEDLLEQESSKIKDYIKSNYNKTGEIADFEIYYIK